MITDNKLNYNRYKLFYSSIIRKEFIYRNSFNNLYQIPKISKITIQSTSKHIVDNKKHILSLVYALKLITGQKPLLIKSKKSIASFKIREGMIIGVKVILRNENLYNFLDNFITLVLPKKKKFVKIDTNKKGLAFNLGIDDIKKFNEIEYNSFLFKKFYGLNVNIDFNKKVSKEEIFLLSSLKIPVV